MTEYGIRYIIYFKIRAEYGKLEAETASCYLWKREKS